MSSHDADDLVFRALADARRRQILDLLKNGPRTTGQLCDHFAGVLDRCTVMQHIGVLARADLLVATREGRQRWNHLNAGPIREIYDRWIATYAQPALDGLSQLRRELEAPGS
jgi:DNA-binding transcriptional ArsR family regulator